MANQTRYPGRPHYTGPNSGWALLVHHGELAEWCFDFKERISYIQLVKPVSERKSRLYHLVRIKPSEVPKALRVAKAAECKARAFSDKEWRKYDTSYTAGHYSSKLWNAYCKSWTAVGKTTRALKKGFAAWISTDEPLALLNKHVPDHKWNSRYLVF